MDTPRKPFIPKDTSPITKAGNSKNALLQHVH